MLWIEAVARREGLSGGRIRLLGALAADGPQIMSSLRDRLRVTGRNITQLVDGLEADGLVRRDAHPSDRRATVVALTPAGEETITAGLRRHLDRVGALFDRLEPARRADLLDTVRELTGHLRAAAPGEDCGC